MKKEYFEFYTEYLHNGSKYGCKIFAENRDDAEKQLKSKKQTEKIVGFNPEKIYSED
jgi:hypothetical protein